MTARTSSGHRIAVVTNLCTHYRLPLFERLAERFDADFYFTSSGIERYWSVDHKLDQGPLRVVPAHRSWSLARRVAMGKYDCAVVTLAGRLKLLATVIPLLLWQKPFVLWVGIWTHPATLFHRVTRPLTRWLYRRAGAVLVYGPHVAAHVVHESGRRDHIFVAPQAIENARFRERCAAERIREARRAIGLSQPFVAAFVGRLALEKGIDDLLTAVSLTSDRVGLVLIGSGPEESTLRRSATDLGLEARVSFAGYVDQRRLPAFLQACEALVLPSITTARFKETWGLVANEAMNAGLPVVATTAVGAVAGGLVQDGVTGVVVPERDPKALGDVIDALARDPERCRALGAAGRAHVGSWTYEAAADGVEAAIHAATTNGGTG
jgi:glycosyltransferase involved in cell wall biosynthesis